MGERLVVVLEALLAFALLVGCMLLALPHRGVGHNPVVPHHVVMRDGRLEVADEETEGDVGG